MEARLHAGAFDPEILSGGADDQEDDGRQGQSLQELPVESPFLADGTRRQAQDIVAGSAGEVCGLWRPVGQDGSVLVRSVSIGIAR